MDKHDFDRIVKKKILTQEERNAVAPYRVKRAVIMAAGLGSRLRPLTYEIPKPLICVNGKRIIDTVIEALLRNGIDDIYIVRGYLHEKFDELADKYPMVKMINNLMYDQGNNIISVCMAGNLIADAFVMPADIYIRNPDVFCPYQYSSNVLGYKITSTKDWCIETDKESVIQRLAPGGGNCYKDTGIFYWNGRDGKRLSVDIAGVCSAKEGRQRYWSSVPFELYKDRYRSVVRECSPEDVIEIDTLEDLIEIDASYRRYL